MKYDNYKIHAVSEHIGSGECVIEPEIKTQKQLEEIKHEDYRFFWTIYGSLPEGGINAITDFEYLYNAEWLYQVLMEHLAFIKGAN